MIIKNKFIVLLLAVLLATGLCSAKNIESGQWYQETMNTNSMTDAFEFWAVPGDTVIMRVACEDALRTEIPDMSLYYRATDHSNHYFVVGWSNQYGEREVKVSITNTGWYGMFCELPLSLYNYSNDLAYSVSILRMPDAPLCKEDLDVGLIGSGEYLEGKLDCGADLDAAMFYVTNKCTVQVRMGQKTVTMVPDIKIYDPFGNYITNDYPPEYRAEITATLTNIGIYTVVLNTFLSGGGEYAVSMIRVGAPLYGSDQDIGYITSGETKQGKVDVPGDLDAAFITAVAGDIINLSLSEASSADSAFNPVVELFAPDGTRLARGTDIFQENAIITNITVSTDGVYTVVCKDAEDRNDVSYNLYFAFGAGSPSLASLPPAPSSITATKGTYTNKIEVTWSAAEGATHYHLYRSYGTNPVELILSNTTSLSYSDTNITAGVRYYYKVKSKNSYGISSNFSPTAEGYAGSGILSANRAALIVGIDHYSPSYGLSDLTACVLDARGIRDTMMLADPSNRWNSTNITLYTDSQATKFAIQSTLNQLASTMQAGDLVVYYHSSHGGQTTPGTYDVYICTYNANYTDAELGADLALFNTETKVIVILDTCFSGGMFKDGRHPMDVFIENCMKSYRKIKSAKLKSSGLAVPKDLGNNIAFMTASAYDEYSIEIPNTHGLYSGYLIDACKTSLADTNNDSEYSFMELHSYAANKVAASPYGSSQHPQTFNINILSENIARAVGSNVPGATNIVYNDFDGDLWTDLALYNYNTGTWRIGSLGRWALIAYDDFVWGGQGYLPIAGDYDGDRVADLALYNETLGHWKVGSLYKRKILISSAYFGGPNYQPVAGDFDGDKIYDGALVERTEGFWYIITTTGNKLVWGRSLTGIGFRPVAGDYDGDRISDVTMFGLNSATWYSYNLATKSNALWGTVWGYDLENPTVVPGDYDGDGYFDLALYVQSTGRWYIYSPKTAAVLAYDVEWGGAGFIPVSGDFNGDGKYDLAVYNESTGLWMLRTVDGTASFSVVFGGAGYIPVPVVW